MRYQVRRAESEEKLPEDEAQERRRTDETKKQSGSLEQDKDTKHEGLDDWIYPDSGSIGLSFC